MTLFVFCITNKVVFSHLLTSILFICLGIVYILKVDVRQEAFVLTDIWLLKESLVMIKVFPRRQQVAMLGGVGLGILFLIFLLIKEKGQKFSIKERYLGFCGTLCLIVCSDLFLYHNGELYQNAHETKSANFSIKQYETHGFSYVFARQVSVRNEKYSISSILLQGFEQLNLVTPEITVENQPHIIMVMSESYSDLSENPNFNFKIDPMKVFKEMGDSENGIRGNLIVPNFAGGTANAEFDVLTATPTRLLDARGTSYYNLTKPIEAMPSLLHTIGYDSVAIHPGNRWFYKREDVYPLLGFEYMYFLENAFDLETQGQGGYISEKATTDKILQTFTEHLEERDTPLFSFTVTIQNHSPYLGKYGDIEPLFETDIELDAGRYDSLNQYFYAVQQCDIELLRLYEFAQASEEPIVIVYFGDHRPAFPLYPELYETVEHGISTDGDLDEQIKFYETPFLIWQNDASKEDISIKENAKEIDLTRALSANYLAPMTMELLGYYNISHLFDFVNNMRTVMPSYTPEIFLDDEIGEYKSTYEHEFPKEKEELLEVLQSWQHYMIYENF